MAKVSFLDARERRFAENLFVIPGVAVSRLPELVFTRLIRGIVPSVLR